MPPEHRMLHELTFPEVLTSKCAVCDLQGYLVGGPDRQGSNAINPVTVFITWQKNILDASARDAKSVPPAVHAYFQATKHLTRPPVEGTVIDITPPAEQTLAQSLGMAPGGAPPAGPKAPEKFHFATSYTGMKEFQTCARKWAASKFYKTVPYEEGPEAAEGNMVHKAMENVLTNVILADEIKMLKERGYAKYLSAILDARKAGAVVHAERELCFTKDLEPCGWKDWNRVFFRFKGDVIVEKLPRITYIDWKCGKRYSKRGDDQADIFQLECAWAVISIYYPEAQEFVGKLIYLKQEELAKAIVSVTYTRADLPAIWEKILNVTGRMEAAVAAENFRMQKSGLCQQYCGDLSCVHNGRR